MPAFLHGSVGETISTVKARRLVLLLDLTIFIGLIPQFGRWQWCKPPLILPERSYH